MSGRFVTAFILFFCFTLLPDLTAENIASRIHLSTNCLRNIFKEHMGISLSKYITDRKIQYACKILVETDDSIQSTSERPDYTSPLISTHILKGISA